MGRFPTLLGGGSPSCFYSQESNDVSCLLAPRLIGMPVAGCGKPNMSHQGSGSGQSTPKRWDSAGLGDDLLWGKCRPYSLKVS